MKQIFWPLALFAITGLVLAGIQHRSTPTPEPPASNEYQAVPNDHWAYSAVEMSTVMHSYQVPKDPYVVPHDGALHRMQVTVTDQSGTRVVYDRQHSGGDKVQVALAVPGNALLRFYDNDALKGEAAL